MKENTYTYCDAGGSYHLVYAWRFEDGILGERFAILNNLNALIFFIETLQRLGYKEK